MKSSSLFRLALLAAAIGAPSSIKAEPEWLDKADLFSFASGARILQAPEDSDMAQMAWSPLNLIDDSVATDWTGQGGEVSFVFELAETTELQRIVFDNGVMDRDSKAIKDFIVEVSETSPTKGYREVLSGSLKMKKNGQSFTFKPEERPSAKWVRLTILSNYGDDYQAFMGFHGYGKQLTAEADMPDLTGKYDGASGWGLINLTDADEVSGCYEYQAGIFEGRVQGRVLMLDMTERANDNTRLVGLFQLAPDGRKLYGIVRSEDAGRNPTYASYYSAEKRNGKPNRC